MPPAPAINDAEQVPEVDSPNYPPVVVINIEQAEQVPEVDSPNNPPVAAINIEQAE